MDLRELLKEYEKLNPHNAATVTRDGKEVTFEFRYCDQYDGDRDVIVRHVERVSAFQSLRSSNITDAATLAARRQKLLDEVNLIDAIAATL